MVDAFLPKPESSHIDAHAKPETGAFAETTSKLHKKKYSCIYQDHPVPWEGSFGGGAPISADPLLGPGGGWGVPPPPLAGRSLLGWRV